MLPAKIIQVKTSQYRECYPNIQSQKGLHRFSLYCIFSNNFQVLDEALVSQRSRYGTILPGHHKDYDFHQHREWHHAPFGHQSSQLSNFNSEFKIKATTMSAFLLITVIQMTQTYIYTTFIFKYRVSAKISIFAQKGFKNIVIL